MLPLQLKIQEREWRNEKMNEESSLGRSTSFWMIIDFLPTTGSPIYQRILKANTALLPVRGTFDEELYRRRRERHPRTRETEREASRGVNYDNARDRSGVILLDSQNTETFGDPSGSFSTRPFSEAYGSKANDGTQASSSFLPVVDPGPLSNHFLL